jgi:hypothetical protein
MLAVEQNPDERCLLVIKLNRINPTLIIITQNKDP